MNETDAAREEGAVSASSDYSDLVALAMGGAQDVPSLPDTSLVRHAADASQPLAALDASDVLAQLAVEYREALMSVGQEPKRLKRLGDGCASGPLPPDPLRPNTPTTSAVCLFDDLLGPRRIDRVLDGLDSFGAQQLFTPPPRHEILRLFAGRNLQTRRTGQFALLARQEHHASSMDSCLAMPEIATNMSDDTGERHATT
jgi:hypothetical protein